MKRKTKHHVTFNIIVTGSGIEEDMGIDLIFTGKINVRHLVGKALDKIREEAPYYIGNGKLVDSVTF